MNKPIMLNPGDNARIDIQRDMNSGALIVLTMPNQATRRVQATHVRVSRDNAIGCALALLQSADVSIEEIHRRLSAVIKEKEKKT